jgi:hypothetical protein
MIDTIRFYIKKDNDIMINYDYLETKLTNIQHTVNLRNENEVRFSGQIKNFQFKEHKYVYSLEGSIPKFIHGNNFESVTRTQIIHFTEELSNTLQLNLFDANISRIDITNNIITEKSPVVYMPYLGECRYFEKAEYQNNGIQYINKSRHLSFYDKQIEARISKSSVPLSFSGKNVLRFEYSIRKNLLSHLGFKVNSISDIIHPDHFCQLPEVWLNQYLKIHKIYEGIGQLEGISDNRSYWEHIIRLGLNTQGETRLIEHINLLSNMGLLKCPRQVNRLKKTIRTYFANAAVAEPEKYLITEINQKMVEKANEDKEALCG